MPGMHTDTEDYTCQQTQGDNGMQQGQVFIHLGTQVQTLGDEMIPYSQNSPTVVVDYASIVPARELGLGVCGGNNCMLRC